MYRDINDFIQDWQINCKGTLSIFESITEEKKGFEIVDGHNSLESLSWHLTNAPFYFAGLIGLNLDMDVDPTNTPSTMSEIINTYKNVSNRVVEAVKKELNNDSLLNEIDNHGKATPIGSILRSMVDHQTHHRGQMQVLLRQAGLNVPSVMGPTKEASLK